MILKVHTPDLGGNVEVTFRSPSGRITVAVLPLRESIFRKALADWKAGELIQSAFPTLDADQRELIVSGIGKAEWDAMFPEDPADASQYEGGMYEDEPTEGPCGPGCTCGPS